MSSRALRRVGDLQEPVYDAAADFCAAGRPDSDDDSVTAALLEQIGPPQG